MSGRKIPGWTACQPGILQCWDCSEGQAQPAGEFLHVGGGVALRGPQGLVDGGHDHVLQHLHVVGVHRVGVDGEDMIVAAVNEALRAAESDAASNMQKLTGGLGLPF